MADERKLGSSAPTNRWPYFRLVTFLSYVHQLPDDKHIFVGFWPRNISLFPVVHVDRSNRTWTFMALNRPQLGEPPPATTAEGQPAWRWARIWAICVEMRWWARRWDLVKALGKDRRERGRGEKGISCRLAMAGEKEKLTACVQIGIEKSKLYWM
jgi:hypothetical protein